MAEKQTQLFDDPTACAALAPLTKNGRKKVTCTPKEIGSGPIGETCKTCDFCERIKWHDKAYHKCRLMRKHWTHGGGSDIRLKWAACKSWFPKEFEDRVRGLGDLANAILDQFGIDHELALSVIADHYDQQGVDVFWIRLAAQKGKPK